MNVSLDAQEQEVLQAVALFLENECPPTVARISEDGYSGISHALWRKFADLGWLTLCLPEDVGGQALPLTYIGLLLEEVGKVIAPLPVHSTMATALVIDKHGSAAQRAMLRRVGTGDLILAYAVTEASGVWEPSAIAMPP